MTVCAGRWNHNIHYYPVLLDALPDGCERALDVGCGEGTLARELRRFVRHVSAIDLDEPSIKLARQHDAASDIQYRLGDFLAFPFEPASFDLVVSVAALHHMNAVVALQRMHELLRPGGKLAVLGLARSQYPADLPRDAAATLVSRAYRATKNYWESSAPTVWPPLQTYAEMRCLAEHTLPQVRFRRHLLWRYSLILTKSTP
jgi:2-polyprenyl-3-methyl-5-hydroxy-6-metoxy-1,4-benzoquinol methylase